MKYLGSLSTVYFISLSAVIPHDFQSLRMQIVHNTPDVLFQNSILICQNVSTMLPPTYREKTVPGMITNDAVITQTADQLRNFILRHVPTITFESPIARKVLFIKLGIENEQEWQNILDTEPPNIPTPPLPPHIKAKLKPSTYTQTEAQLSITSIRNELAKRYKFGLSPQTPITSEYIQLISLKGGPSAQKIKQYQYLVNAVLKKERAYKNSHFVFYHAFAKTWLLLQDIYFQMFVSLHPLSRFINDFRFLRWAQTGKTEHINDFLMESMKSIGLINDNTELGRTTLLSTNLALFGNVGFDGECTFEYFITPKSHAQVSAPIFNSIFEPFDIPPSIYQKYIPQLEAVGKKYLYPASENDSSQVLLQIFIPKIKIDDIGYLAWIRGVPREQQLVAWVENESKESIGRPPRFALSAQVLNMIEGEFKKLRKTDPLYAQLLQGITQGKYRLSPILDQYTNTPERVPDLNYLQARLLLSSQLLIPQEDVRMYTYDFISPTSKKLYQLELKQIIQKLRNEFLKWTSTQQDTQKQQRQNQDQEILEKNQSPLPLAPETPPLQGTSAATPDTDRLKILAEQKEQEARDTELAQEQEKAQQAPMEDASGMSETEIEAGEKAALERTEQINRLREKFSTQQAEAAADQYAGMSERDRRIAQRRAQRGQAADVKEIHANIDEFIKSRGI